MLPGESAVSTMPFMQMFTALPTYKYCALYLQPDGIVLAYTFEEPFGDIYDKGVWSELRGMAATNIQENIVALASFNGDL